MNGIRLTQYGQLNGTYKTADGTWMMSVRTGKGKWLEVPHDGMEGPKTKNTKKKGK